MSITIVLSIVAIFAMLAINTLTGTMFHSDYANRYEKTAQIKLDTEIVFNTAISDITAGANTFAWGSESVAGTLFNGIAVQPINNAYLSTFPVGTIAANSFYIQKTWTLSSGSSGTYMAACFQNCGTESLVKQWYVHVLTASDDFTQKKTAVIAVKKGDAIWDITAAGEYDDKISIPVTTGWGEGFKVADVNNDGIPDVLLNGAPQVLIGQGDGTFSNGASFEPGFSPFNIEVGDFNKDGNVDVSYTQWPSTSIKVRFGNGNGTFGAATDSPNTTVTPNLTSLEAGDINNDGFPDLITVRVRSHLDVDPTHFDSIGVRVNNGDGTFAPEVNYVDPVTNMNSSRLADFNNDGNLDILVQHGTLNGTSLFLGRGDGNFNPGAWTGLVSNGKNPAAADLNGDGNIDFTAFSGSGFKIFRGAGDGTFANAGSLSTGGFNTLTGYENTTKIIDIDGDGHKDIITASNTEGTVSIHKGHGDLTFEPRKILPATPNGAEFDVVDLNGDGLLDIIVRQQSNTTNYPISVIIQHQPVFTAQVLKIASKNY
jgi:hypothetical protein